MTALDHDHEVAVSLTGVTKTYHLYRRPEDRLKQLFLGRFGAHYDQAYNALETIDLEVRRGETVGLIGRNGAGKSTLLQIVCGTLTPTTGEVRVAGRIAAMIELGAGFNPDFTGRENVRLSATVAGLTARQINERLPSIIAFAGIGDFIDQPVKLYSSGMYARLAFAVSAHVDADILVVDEILAVGDAVFELKCQRFISEFKKRGTLLFVSHNIGAVISLCDRVVWFEQGRIRANGPAKEIAKLYMAASDNGGDRNDDFNIGRARAKRQPDTAATLSTPGAQPGLQCDITVSKFNPDAPSSGAGGAAILSVGFLDADGRPVHRLKGGEMTTVAISCKALTDLSSPLVGFQIDDDRGQLIVGANTDHAYRNRPVPVVAGQQFDVTFDLQLPYLRSGVYTITAAISDGTQLDKIHHQWMHDVISLSVTSSSTIRGLTWLPMRSIEVVQSEQETAATV